MFFTRKHAFIMAIAIIFITAGVVIVLRFIKPPQTPAPLPSMISLPDFMLKDIDGNTIALSSFNGTPLIVDVWASWCVLCKDHMYQLSSIQKELNDTFVIVEVNRRESSETAKAYIKQLSLRDPVRFMFDENDRLYEAIGGFLMPESIFIDKNGIIRDHTRGSLGAIEMRRRIQDAFDL